MYADLGTSFKSHNQIGVPVADLRLVMPCKGPGVNGWLDTLILNKFWDNHIGWIILEAAGVCNMSGTLQRLWRNDTERALSWVSIHEDYYLQLLQAEI